MKSKSLLVVLAMMVVLCSCGKIDVSNLSDSNIPQPSQIPDITLTYTKYIPEPGEGIVFNSLNAINENCLIYYHDEDGLVRYGFMDLEFNKITDTISNNAPYFYNGLACVIARDSETNEVVYNVYDKNLTLLNIDGKTPFWYDDIWLSSEDIFLTSRTVDANGDREKTLVKIFTDSKFGNIDPEGTLVPIKSENGLYGYKTFTDVYINNDISEDGYHIPPIFERAYDFSEGLAVVRMDGKYGYINTEGMLTIDCQYSDAKEFSNGIAQVSQTDEETTFENTTFSLIDTEGNAVSDSEYAIIREYREGFASAGKFGILNGGVMIDEDGKEHFNDLFRKAWGFIDGISLVQDAYGKFFYIDKNGYNINGRTYKDAKEFSDGLAVVLDHDKYGYINRDGLMQIEPIYEYATSFNNGFAIVRPANESLNYVIDKMENKYLEELDLDGLSQFNEEGFALGYSNVDEEGHKIYYLIHME